MDSSKYRVFVCTKKRAADDPDGCCCDRNALYIYQEFQQEIERLQLQDKIEVRKSGCERSLRVWCSGNGISAQSRGIWLVAN